MANVFRSKEVFKHPNKNLHGRNEIIPVRGVYVSGEYKPPYYSESGLRITEINSTHAKVVDFTTKSQSSGYDNVLRLLTFDIDNTCPDFVQYTTASASSGLDHVLRLIDFDVDSSCPDCLFFTQASASSGYDHVLKLIDFDVDNTLPDFQLYSSIRNSSPPEPLLRLTTITTEKATISNYNT